MKINVIYLLLAFFLILFIYGRFIESDMVQVRKINIEAGFIKDVLKGKTVVHLSDLHLSGLGEKEEEILNKIEQINPDLILLTGDYIKWSGDIAPVLKFFSRLKAKIGVFAVMGDYDYSNSRTSCLFCHEKGKARLTSKHNVIMLANSSHKIKINDQVIEITGIDRGYDEQLAFKANAKANEKNILRLVLSHSPLSFDDLDSKDKILMFAGDTHGGQVKLPLWVFKLFGYDKNVKYNYGLFYQENKTMYVTRGTGTSHFKFRLFCPPEIAVFEF